MDFPEDLKYTKEHEWVKVEGKTATVGITEYAQDQLGDIVFVELPEEGDTLAKNDALGVVESVKAVSDIYAPVGGEVVEVNTPLKDTPEQLNEDPYGDAWIARLEVTNLEELDELLTADQYAAFVAEESA